MKKYLECPDCKSTLQLSQWYSGADWDSKAGEGSGFGWGISLDCDCGRTFTIGYIKKLQDFSEVIDELKCVK